MKNIVNIVITGGPCGGKTTALDEISSLLRSLGYVVYLVNETATELINDGIKPFGDNKLELIDFQKLIYEAQLCKENIRRNAAQYAKEEKIAILYDRGLLDNRAYISNEEFQKIIHERNNNESDIISRYDLVIHLVTAAIGKEKYYITSNNTARTETIAEARLMDQKTMEAWANHPNLRIVNNDTLFHEKIEKVKNIIRAYIGEQVVIKQEKYYLKIDDVDLNKFNYPAIKEEIETFARQYDDNNDIVYVKNTINNSSYYTRLTNRYQKDGTKLTTCKKVAEEEYLYNLSLVNCEPLKKIRFNFIDDGERFRLDFYKDYEEPFYILERDVSNSDRKKMPIFIKGYIDSTKDRNCDDDSVYIDYNIEKIIKKYK